jgi:hypothetical protein
MAGFELAIPASYREQTCAFDDATTGIGFTHVLTAFYEDLLKSGPYTSIHFACLS